MKNLFLRSGLALACALTLAACGGDDDGNLPLGGGVANVTMDGLVLSNKGVDLAVPAGASSFLFPQYLGANVDYEITIKTPPPNATCEVLNGKGKTNPYGPPQNIGVLCTLFPRAISGTITGPTAGGLEIINGKHRVEVPAGSTSFTMTVMTDTPQGKVAVGTVGEGQPYGLTIFRQPTGSSCTIANGTGFAAKTDITNIVITCI